MIQGNRNDFRYSLSIILAILIQYRRMALVLDGPGVICDEYFLQLTKTLSKVWKLSSQQAEDLQEIVSCDKEALKSFLENHKEKLLEFCPEDVQKTIFIQSVLEKMILVMVLRPSNGRDTVYDARLRRIFKDFVHLFFKDGEIAVRNVNLAMLLNTSENLMVQYYGAELNSSDIIKSEDEEEQSGKLKRWAGVGIATVTGGILIGVTGGLAAPFIAAGLTTVSSSLGLAGASAAFASLGTVAGSAVVGTIFGISGAGLAGFKLNKHYKELDEFNFTPLNGNEPEDAAPIAYTIVIPGWLNSLDAAPAQWQIVKDNNPLQEILILNYERKNLVELALAIRKYVASNAISYGAFGAAAMTSAATLATALTLPIGMINAASMIDNPWNIALSKSDQAGILLARSVLSAYVGGKRPVTLIGHGMGARVIIKCLLELYTICETGQDLFGVVENVYLFGCCSSLSNDQWINIRRLVADRFVNCYSENDWLLRIIFRLHRNHAAGSSAIDVEGIENIDLSNIVKSHDGYFEHQEEIFHAVGYERH